MKLKYYLRGLGIGIVVTALLMGFATKDRGIMTDEEIKARAAQLGMVEQRTLADIRDNAVATEVPASTEVPTEAPTEEPQVTQEPEETEEPQVTQEPEETEDPQATQGPEETEEPQVTQGPEETDEPQVTQEPEETEEPQVTQELGGTEEPQVTQEPEATEEPEVVPGDIVRIEIKAGDSSEVVSRRLEKAGLVESANKFNRYLLNKNLTKVLRIGTFELEIGMSIEEIADIITY